MDTQKYTCLRDEKVSLYKLATSLENLPHLVIVVDGVSLGNKIEISTGEMLMLESMGWQDRAIAHDCEGRTLSIPLDYRHRFSLTKKKSHADKGLMLREVVQQRLPVAVRFTNEDNLHFFNTTPAAMARLTVVHTLPVPYFVARPVHNGVAGSNVIVLPTYLKRASFYPVKGAENTTLCSKDILEELSATGTEHTYASLIGGDQDIVLLSHKRITTFKMKHLCEAIDENVYITVAKSRDLSRDSGAHVCEQRMSSLPTGSLDYSAYNEADSKAEYEPLHAVFPSSTLPHSEKMSRPKVAAVDGVFSCRSCENIEMETEEHSLQTTTNYYSPLPTVLPLHLRFTLQNESKKHKAVYTADGRDTSKGRKPVSKAYTRNATLPIRLKGQNQKHRKNERDTTISSKSSTGRDLTSLWPSIPSPPPLPSFPKPLLSASDIPPSSSPLSPPYSSPSLPLSSFLSPTCSSPPPPPPPHSSPYSSPPLPLSSLLSPTSSFSPHQHSLPPFSLFPTSSSPFSPNLSLLASPPASSSPPPSPPPFPPPPGSISPPPPPPPPASSSPPLSPPPFPLPPPPPASSSPPLSPPPFPLPPPPPASSSPPLSPPFPPPPPSGSFSPPSSLPPFPAPSPPGSSSPSPPPYPAPPPPGLFSPPPAASFSPPPPRLSAPLRPSCRQNLSGKTVENPPLPIPRQKAGRKEAAKQTKPALPPRPSLRFGSSKHNGKHEQNTSEPHELTACALSKTHSEPHAEEVHELTLSGSHHPPRRCAEGGMSKRGLTVLNPALAHSGPALDRKPSTQHAHPPFMEQNPSTQLCQTKSKLGLVRPDLPALPRRKPTRTLSTTSKSDAFPPATQSRCSDYFITENVYDEIKEVSTVYEDPSNDYCEPYCGRRTAEQSLTKDRENSSKKDQGETRPSVRNTYTHPVSNVKSELENVLAKRRTKTHDNICDTKISPKKHSNSPSKQVTSSFEKMTTNDVASALEKLKLGHYAEQFQSHLVDGVILAQLNPDTLREDFHMNGLEVIRLMTFIKTGHLPK